MKYVKEYNLEENEKLAVDSGSGTEMKTTHSKIYYIDGSEKYVPSKNNLKHISQNVLNFMEEKKYGLTN